MEWVKYIVYCNIWAKQIFSRSSTLGQTLVTVLPSTVNLRYSAGLYWDYNRQHLLYVDRTLKQFHLADFTMGLDVFITTSKNSFIHSKYLVIGLFKISRLTTVSGKKIRLRWVLRTSIFKYVFSNFLSIYWVFKTTL